MALRIRTVMTYPLDGSTEFIIPFEYLARKFVTVTLVGQDRKELILNQDFRFVEKTKIQTSRTWTTNDGYSLIEIRRYTSATERLVDFADGSILRAYDLNISQVQTLHVAEEARDLTADTIGVNNEGRLDARGRRIVNVADAVDDFDVINLNTVKVWNNSVYQSYIKALAEADRSKSEADRSQAARQGAELARDASLSATTRSEVARDRAILAETNSKTSEISAKTSEINSKTSEINSKTSETNSKSSEINSKSSADRAKVEADKLGNMNEFAATIDSVDSTLKRPTFKAGIQSKSILINQPASTWDAQQSGIDIETDATNVASGSSVIAAGISTTLKASGATYRNQKVVKTLGSDVFCGEVVTKAPAGGSYTEVGRYGISTDSGRFVVTAPAEFISAGEHRLSNTVISDRGDSGGNALDGGHFRSRLNGRYQGGDTAGAVAEFYYQEIRDSELRAVISLSVLTGGQNSFVFKQGGNIVTGLGTVAFQGSDVRLKDNIVPASEGAAERLSKIGLVEYNWRESGRRERGWIAQQLDGIDPLYTYQSGRCDAEDSTDILNVSSNSIMADLIAEVVQLRLELEEIKRRT